ncbi:MAG: hypothetical protein WBE46_03035 [Dehalococcoidia bacterium]
MFGSKGKIDIAIQKFNYALGDTISGSVALTLKKPVKARKVNISLIGEQLITNTQDTSRKGILMGGGGMGEGIMRPMMSERRGSEGITIGARREQSTMTERVCIYDFKLPLDGEKEYSEGRESYFFEMKIPADILSVRPQMTSPIKSPSKWYLLAKLDVPGGLDISKKVDITIG